MKKTKEQDKKFIYVPCRFCLGKFLKKICRDIKMSLISNNIFAEKDKKYIIPFPEKFLTSFSETFTEKESGSSFDTHLKLEAV